MFTLERDTKASSLRKWRRAVRTARKGQEDFYKWWTDEGCLRCAVCYQAAKEARKVEKEGSGSITNCEVCPLYYREEAICSKEYNQLFRWEFRVYSLVHTGPRQKLDISLVQAMLDRIRNLPTKPREPKV